jgi:hypothetical protein
MAVWFTWGKSAFRPDLWDWLLNSIVIKSCN